MRSAVLKQVSQNKYGGTIENTEHSTLKNIWKTGKESATDNASITDLRGLMFSIVGDFKVHVSSPDCRFAQQKSHENHLVLSRDQQVTLVSAAKQSCEHCSCSYFTVVLRSQLLRCLRSPLSKY